MIELLIEDEQQVKELTPELTEAVRRVAEHALEYESFGFDAEISVIFVDNERIREINKEHRGTDRATDVLSFPMLEFDPAKSAPENVLELSDCDLNENGAVILGDIVISLERAAEQAAEYGHSLLREVAFLTAHSMLHLLGYDHVDDEHQARIMFKKQEEILQDLGYTRDAQV